MGSCSSDQNDQMTAKFRCPITSSIFNQPVVANDGYIYEEEALIKWLKNNVLSPITRQKITSYNRCVFIKDLIHEHIEKNPRLKNDIYHIQNEKQIIGMAVIPPKQLIDQSSSLNIRERAYFIYLERVQLGISGNELEDWLMAEREIKLIQKNIMVNRHL